MVRPPLTPTGRWDVLRSKADSVARELSPRVRQERRACLWACRAAFAPACYGARTPVCGAAHPSGPAEESGWGRRPLASAGLTPDALKPSPRTDRSNVHHDRGVTDHHTGRMDPASVAHKPIVERLGSLGDLHPNTAACANLETPMPASAPGNEPRTQPHSPHLPYPSHPPSPCASEPHVGIAFTTCPRCRYPVGDGASRARDLGGRRAASADRLGRGDGFVD